MPFIPFALGLLTGAVAVHLLRSDAARAGLDKVRAGLGSAEGHLREAAASGLATIETSSARLCSRLAEGGGTAAAEAAAAPAAPNAETAEAAEVPAAPNAEAAAAPAAPDAETAQTAAAPAAEPAPARRRTPRKRTDEPTGGDEGQAS
jgi:uncharacterized membrane protein